VTVGGLRRPRRAPDDKQAAGDAHRAADTNCTPLVVQRD
jgi:hypothetical protein